MKIIWLPTALDDLLVLADYIALSNPGTALKISQTIRQSVKKLTLFPQIGRQGSLKDTKELVIPNLPYIVVYTVTTEIVVLAVFHTSRKWSIL